MKKNFLMMLCIIVSISAQAQLYGSLSTISSTNVGIGVPNPAFKLDITNQTGEPQNLFRVKAAGAANDYFIIKNATLQPGQFIPTLSGFHDSDNRQALYITGEVGPSNDSGYEPLMVFDARVTNAPVVTRPLFGWDSYGVRKMTLTAYGDLGIGTSTPWNRLHILGPAGDSDTGIIRVDGTSTSTSLRIGIHNDYSWIQAHGSKPLYINSLGNNTVLNHTGGNVGIGTSSPDAKLTVAGKISSREVLVTVDAGSGPDYVFEKGYDLPSLPEIESYIKENKHLPEVPSAKEMEAKGLNLKEMNLLLLKKVEELTLHLIEQHKKIESQAELIQQQNDRLKKLED